MSNSKVFVNGTLVADRPFGYAVFTVPLDGLLRAGENEVRVIIDVPEKSSRWYPGFGIYRDVRLVSVPDDHLVPGSVSVVFGKVTREVAEGVVSYEMSRSGSMKRTLIIDNPRLWSPEEPNLYVLELAGEKIRYGIRTLRYDSTEGFFLNGRHRQMKGVCLHHDLGVFGAAFRLNAARRQLALLKEMGCDTIRTSHNPPAPAFLDLCDEMGFMVLAEAFDEWTLPKVNGGIASFWQKWHVEELETLVKTARRHPSVVMWSVGNELGEDGNDHREAEAEKGRAIGLELTEIVHRNDPEGRPVTAGHWWPVTITNGIGTATDVFGANYLPNRYAEFRGRQGVIGTETCSTASSRGVYSLPVSNQLVVENQVLSYDVYPVHANDYPPDVEFTAQEANPHVYGEFVWTGFDYIGEPDPWRGRARSSYFGIFDLAGFPKDRYWLYKSQWRPEVPTAHILPHWNWHEGDKVPVHVYSNGDEAELFVNGVSQGRHRRNPGIANHRFVWQDVPFHPGMVSVRVFRKGVLWAEDRVRTSGAFDHFEFSDAAFGELLFRTARAVDEKGVFVPTAAENVEYRIPKGYALVGTCNGDAADMSSLKSARIRSFSGLALIVFERLQRGR